MSESRFVIPLTMASSCPATASANQPAGITAQDYTPETPIAFAGSSLSLITGIRIDIGNGATITNDQISPYFINAFRLVTEHDMDFYDSEGAEIQFILPSGFDSCNSNLPTLYNSAIPSASAPSGLGGSTGTFWGTPTVVPSTSAASFTGSFYNTSYGTSSAGTNYGVITPATTSATRGVDVGFQQRVDAFHLNAQITVPGQVVVNSANKLAYTGKVIQMLNSLPLELLHDFWNNQNFPMQNDRWAYYLNLGFSPLALSQVSGSTTSTTPISMQNNGFNAFQVGYGVPSPIVAIGANGQSNCRMYYNSLLLSPDVAVAVAEQVQKGAVKQIWYNSTDPVIYRTGQTSLANVISTGSKRPLRVIDFNYVNSTSTPSSTYLSTWTNPGPYLTYPLYQYLKGLNLNVNATQYFQQSFNTPVEYWMEVIKGLPQSSEGYTSILNWNKFLNGLCPLVFDISKAKDSLSNPNQPITIEYQGNQLTNFPTGAVGGSALDTVYVIETEKCVVLSMDKNSSTITIGVNI